MSRSRRPSVSVYDYPEHLNPFNDESPMTKSRPRLPSDTTTKDARHKFWTFGRSRKKRSHSFSIKSTWSGLFGKRKDVPDSPEKRLTITTVSTIYKRKPNDRPLPAARLSKDQQEFDEALGTLARRRKYTMDVPSRHGSSLTMNGDPARIYEGSPQDTTTSIMGDVTPKPPARRFGQVSPRPTDKIPPLKFDENQPTENGTAGIRERNPDETPVAPVRRFGLRSSQRLNASTFDTEDEANRSGDVSLRDENENVPDDYVFKRFSHDAVRKSNLSINSCVSVTSSVSTFGRKKRRAPQPPRPREQQNDQEEGDNIHKASDTGKIELQIREPIDIATVTEDIDAMTRKSETLECTLQEENEDKVKQAEKMAKDVTNENLPNNAKDEVQSDDKVSNNIVKEPQDSFERNTESIAKGESLEDDSEVNEPNSETSKQEIDTVPEATQSPPENPVKQEDDINVEYRRESTERLEIIKDLDADTDEVCLRKKSSSESLSRSDSFSVKEEIEKIEKQIKALESKNITRDSSGEEQAVQDVEDVATSEKHSRASIQANRRHFFQHMVTDDKSGVKIAFKELPREQKSIDVIRLTDSPVPIDAPREPVKVIELHISEPIRHRPELVDDVNPIPKPRRHSAMSINNAAGEQKNDGKSNGPSNEYRGHSV